MSWTLEDVRREASSAQLSAKLMALRAQLLGQLQAKADLLDGLAGRGLTWSPQVAKLDMELDSTRRMVGETLTILWERGCVTVEEPVRTSDCADERSATEEEACNRCGKHVQVQLHVDCPVCDPVWLCDRCDTFHRQELAAEVAR